MKMISNNITSDCITLLECFTYQSEVHQKYFILSHQKLEWIKVMSTYYIINTAVKFPYISSLFFLFL